MRIERQSEGQGSGPVPLLPWVWALPLAMGGGVPSVPCPARLFIPCPCRTALALCPLWHACWACMLLPLMQACTSMIGRGGICHASQGSHAAAPHAGMYVDAIPPGASPMTGSSLAQLTCNILGFALAPVNGMTGGTHSACCTGPQGACTAGLLPCCCPSLPRLLFSLYALP